MQTSTATMENSVEIPKKTGNRTAIWPSNPTAGHIHQGNQNWKRHVYPNVHHSTVYIARTWKQPRCPSADEWIKLWYIYTMEYYSAIKKNAFDSILMRWMKLEPIIQSKVNQKVLVAKSCLTLCDPMGCSPLGSSIHGISQARILEWVAISFSRESSQPRDRTRVSHSAGSFFIVWATREEKH